MVRLKSVEVSGVRGFPKGWGSIEIGERGLVVYGDNGTGKSSIVDAIECVLAKEVTLFQENRQGVNWDNAAQNVRCSSYNATLKVLSSGDEYSVYKPIGKSKIPHDVLSYVESAALSKFVFRRHMLVSFIVSQPKDRYLAFEYFLDLQKFSAIESATKRIVDTTNTVKLSVQAECTRHESSLRQALFGGLQNTIDDASVIDALNKFLATAQIAACSDLKTAQSALKTVSDMVKAEISEKRLGAIASLKSALQRMPTTEELLQHAENLLAAATGFLKARSAATEENLIEWLITGRGVVSQDTSGSCPLCKQPIDKQGLLAQLEERIGSNRRYLEAKQDFTSRSGEFRAATRRFLDALPVIINDWESTVGNAAPKELVDYEQFLTDASKQAMSIPPSLDALRSIGERLRKGLPINDYTKAVDNLFTAEGGARRQAIMAAMSAATIVVEEYPKIVSIRQRLTMIGQRCSELSRVQDLASGARKEIVQGIFGKIAGYANTLYAQIHPEEAIGSSNLAVKITADKSVNLTAAFDGRQEHPMLHYSESHLDTLGLCYFLAVRRHEAEKNPNFKLLILDDVLTSVDAAHRLKISFLLKDKFADHQVIITTHDKVFYDRLKATFSGMPVEYATICSWDIERGPVLIRGYSDIDKIRAPMRDTETQEDLSAACGRLAECLLRDFADGIRCPVQFRADGKYTMAELWQPVRVKLDKQNGFKAMHVALATTFDSCAWVRNQCGAHYGAPAAPVTMAEAREFAIQLEKLYDALFCSKCGRIVFKIQGTEDWRCQCGALEYKHK